MARVKEEQEEYHQRIGRSHGVPIAQVDLDLAWPVFLRPLLYLYPCG